MGVRRSVVVRVALVATLAGVGLPSVGPAPRAFADQAADYAALITADGANPYIRLDDTATTGATQAYDVNGGGGAGHNLSYGQPGAVSGDAAEGFNGTNATAAFAFQSPHAYPQVTGEAWIRPSAAGQTAIILQFEQTGWGVQLVGGRLHAWAWTGTFSNHQLVTVDGPRLVTANTWHHVALVEDGVQLQLFLDGIVQGAAAVSAGIAYSDNYELTIGSSSMDTGACLSYPNCYQPGAGWFAGTIDEVALYDHGLSHAQLEAHVLRAGHPLGPPLSSAEIGVMNAASILRCTCAGDPVNTQFGNLIEHATDLVVAGRGPGLVWSRSYNSLTAGSKGRLGYGWSDGYGMRLVEDTARGTVTISQENGAQLTFVNNQGSYVLPSYMFATLIRNGDGTWTFTRKARSVFVFDTLGRLTGLRDLNGRATTLAYDGSGRLATATDAAARTFTFGYTNADTSLVTAVTDTAGARTVGFGYDGSGNLTSVTDVRGKVWSLGYDGGHRLTTILNPSQAGLPASQQHPITNHYDASGRVDYQDDALVKRTTFAYQSDSSGQTTAVTDPSGHVRTDHYDLQGLLDAQTNAPGTSSEEKTSYTYDPVTFGVATEKWSRAGTVLGTRTFSYDSAGNVLTRLEPGATQASVFTYDGLNDVLTFRDPNQVMTTWTYDGAGNVLSVSTPLVGSNPAQNELVAYHRDDAAHLEDVTAVTDANHTVAQQKDWVFVYAAATGVVTRSTDPLGNATTFGYDAISRRTSVVSPKGNATGGNPALFTTSSVYDAAGNLTRVTDPLGHFSTRTFDADGNLDLVTDPDGHVSDYGFDVADQLTTVKRADSPQTTLQNTYDSNGGLHAQVDGAGQSTVYGYSAAGELVSVTDPLGRTTSYGYDGAGNRTSIQDPGGNCAATPKTGCSTLGYRSDNLLASITYSDGVTPNVAYGYDADGQRQTMTTGTDVQRWDWDSLHRLADHVDHYGQANAQTISYGYFLAGQIKTITYATNKTVTHDLWDNGTLKTITDWLGHATQYTPDANGNLITQAYPNGVTATSTLDNADRLMGITQQRSATMLASWAYARDNANLLTGVASTGVGTNETYQYTGLDQLKNVNANSYGYDAADNLTQLTDGTRQAYDVANELCFRSPTTTGACTAPPAEATRYSYDARGNRIQATPTAGVPTAYGYDEANRLTSAKLPYESGNTGQFKPLVRTRVLDTRTSWVAGTCYQPNNTPVGCGSQLTNDVTRTFQVAGLAGSGIPASGVSAVAVNVTVFTPSATSNLVLFPSDAARPGTRDVSFTAGETTSNAVIVKLGADGRVAVTSNAAVDVAVDAYGYYENANGSTAGGTYNPMVPVRVADSRTGLQTSNCPVPTTCAPLSAGGATTIDLGGQGGLPSSGIGAVVFNLTVTNTTATGFAQAWPADEARPATRNLSFMNADTVTEMIVTKVSPTGQIKLYADTSGFNYFIDVLGWYTTSPDPNDALYIPQTSTRVLKTTNLPMGVCSPSPCASIAAGATSTVQITGQAGVPATGASAVSLNISVINPTAAGFITLAPTGVSGSRTVSFATGEQVSNASIMKLNPDGQLAFKSYYATVDLLVEVNGWYEPATKTWTYTYDGDGLRTKKTAPDGTTTTYLWDQSGSLPLLIGETTGTNTTYYLYGPGGLPLQDIQPNGTTVRYYHHDQLGSTRLLTDQTGTTIRTATYDPYGKPTTITGTATTTLGYTGQYTDTETGLQYLHARYYDPTTGTFLTRDPASALTRTPYGYAAASPLNAADPSGLCWANDLLGTGCNQEVGDFAGGIVDSLTLGHGEELLGDDNVDWCSDAAHRGRVYGALAPIALGGYLAASGLFAAETAGGLADEGLAYATRAEKLDHIFAAKHNLGPLVGQFGSREAAVEQMLGAVEGLTPASGTFEIPVTIANQTVVVRGAVIDQVVKLGTAFTP